MTSFPSLIRKVLTRQLVADPAAWRLQAISGVLPAMGNPIQSHFTARPLLLELALRMLSIQKRWSGPATESSTLKYTIRDGVPASAADRTGSIPIQPSPVRTAE